MNTYVNCPNCRAPLTLGLNVPADPTPETGAGSTVAELLPAVRAWIRDATQPKTDARMSPAEAFRDFQGWLTGQVGAHQVTANLFGRTMLAAGVPRGRTSGDRYYRHLELI